MHLSAHPSILSQRISPSHTGSPARPLYLMLVMSFLMESETVREWPASTDQRGGSRGLTARARAVWIRPPALSNIVLAEITMGSMAARPWGEEKQGGESQDSWEDEAADGPSILPSPGLLTSGLIWAGTLENSGLDAKALRFSTASSSGAVAARHCARFSSVKAPSSA